MASILKAGDVFDSFHAFEERLKAFQTANNVVFSRNSSKKNSCRKCGTDFVNTGVNSMKKFCSIGQLYRVHKVPHDKGFGTWTGFLASVFLRNRNICTVQCKFLHVLNSAKEIVCPLKQNSHQLYPPRYSLSAFQNHAVCHRTFFGVCGKSLQTSSSLVFALRSPWNFTFYSSYSSAPSSFLKNQSALLVKRPMRKKIPKIYDEGKTLQVDNVVAYAVAEEIKVESLTAMLVKQGLYTIGELPQDAEKVLHVRGKYSMDKKPKEIFVFEDGSVVFWCVPEIERGAFLKMLGKHANSPYQTSVVLYEREEMDFVNADVTTSLVGDVIHLKEDEPNNMERVLDMYAISNALGQSVKLSLWEASLDKYVSSIISVTEDLRLGRKIGMSRRQVLMKSGELFSLRHLINLSSDLLDTPDFYWERSTLEPLYLSICSYLHIARRTRVMNEKLSHCCELTELLSSELNDAHHTRLEVMIIILILLEVVFEVIHFADKYMLSNSDNINNNNDSLGESKEEAKGDNHANASQEQQRQSASS